MGIKSLFNKAKCSLKQYHKFEELETQTLVFPAVAKKIPGYYGMTRQLTIKYKCVCCGHIKYEKHPVEPFDNRYSESAPVNNANLDDTLFRPWDSTSIYYKKH